MDIIVKKKKIGRKIKKTTTISVLVKLTVFLLFQLPLTYSEERFSVGIRDPELVGVDRTGNELEIFDAMNKVECFLYCVNNPLCKSASYNSDNGICLHYPGEISGVLMSSGVSNNNFQHYIGNTIQQSNTTLLLTGMLMLLSAGKPITQSTYYNDWNCHPTHGVDGIKDTNSIVSTDLEYQPYIWIDLQKTYTIFKVVVYNRVICCGERLKNLHVYVGTSMKEENMELCRNFPRQGYNRQVLELMCKNPLTGSKVLFVLKADGSKQIFNFGEVEVYGS